VIPLGARIIAVADAFAAMTADRPYRIRMSPEAALAELYRCAGTQFDPSLVEALSLVLEADREVEQRPEAV
jgi:HD-GYP domain-containing protein (c-di-GMP phosphodiesterase class II)